MSVVVTPGEIFILKGSGYGLDVAIEVVPLVVPPADVTRVSEGEVRFKIPIGLAEGLHDLKITNVEAGVTFTEVDAVEIQVCDEELLRIILEGGISGQSHPIAKLILVDDDGADIDISSELVTMEIVRRRDDRRTDLALITPPSSSVQVTLRNDEKQFTDGAGGTFDGKLSYGRVIKPEIGYVVGGVRCFFPQGEFLLDDPSFDNTPPATASIFARDKISLALDRKVSVRSLSLRADEYIKEVLEKIGITDSEIDLTPTTLIFSATEVQSDRAAIDIIADVIFRLQTEKAYRLVQINDKLTLIEVPSTGNATQVFSWTRDIKSPFFRTNRSNQSKVRTTIGKDFSFSTDKDAELVNFTGTEADFTGSPKRKTFAFGESIHIEWRQPSGLAQDFVIKEVSRTTTSITFGMVNEADTGDFTVVVRGDELSAAGIVGEAGPGEDQGGVGLGNTLNALLLRRGRTVDFPNSFVTTDGEAQALADVIQRRFGEPIREIEAALNFASPLIEINDLFRIVEKYSNDLNLYHLGEIWTIWESEGPSLTGKIVGQFADITEAPQKYDLAFLYDIGRIYDEDVEVGDQSQEDTSFRGGVVTRIR